MSSVFLTNCNTVASRVSNESLYPQTLAGSPREIYHSLSPHPALSPVPHDDDSSTLLEQARNEEVWRQLLVQGVLAVLLPTEDLENRCLRALVAEIFSEMILGNGLSQKACESWLLWDAITTIIEALQPRTLKDVGKPTVAVSRLEQFGLLSTSADDEGSQHSNLKHPGSAASVSVSGLFWTVIQYIFLASTAVRVVIYAVATSLLLPSRSKTWLSVQSPTQTARQDVILPKSHSEISSTSLSDDHQPILSMSMWSAVGRVVQLDVRMPWLSGMFALLHHLAIFGPGRIGDTDGALDR